MANENQQLWITAIVAIVAITGIVVFAGGSSGTVMVQPASQQLSAPADSNLAGQAYWMRGPSMGAGAGQIYVGDTFYLGGAQWRFTAMSQTGNGTNLSFSQGRNTYSTWTWNNQFEINYRGFPYPGTITGPNSIIMVQ